MRLPAMRSVTELVFSSRRRRELEARIRAESNSEISVGIQCQLGALSELLELFSRFLSCTRACSALLAPFLTLARLLDKALRLGFLDLLSTDALAGGLFLSF